MLTDPGGPRRAAVLGSPVSHSLSPLLHSAAYAALGLTGWSYRRYQVGGPGDPDLPSFLAGLEPDWVGLSLTMPVKEAGLAAAVDASERAVRVAAANTLLRVPAGWFADSTDAVGVCEALRSAGVTELDRAVVIGAGATARSVLDALAGLGCRQVDVLVRTEIRSQTAQLADLLGQRLQVVRLADDGSLRRALSRAQVMVSTVPSGTELTLPDLPRTAAGAVALDVGYAPWPTPFACWAEQAGARVYGGHLMLLYQAAEQVRLMTGRPAPVAQMRSALERTRTAAGSSD